METSLSNPPRTAWLDRPFLSLLTLNWELVLFLGILALAVFTRFYDLGARVMSHDETSHVYYSWRLLKGFGFEHTPLTHGPFQFHVVALSYFLFGDNDFTARIPVVLTSILTVAFMWNFRPYLGRAGALVAAFLLTISPYMLYYGRYVRNESFVGLFGVVALWAILRYLDTGENRYLYWLTLATALHFTTKETSFIYAAQAMLFLGLLFVQQVSQRKWGATRNKQLFLVFLGGAFALILIAAGIHRLSGAQAVLNATETVTPAVPGQEATGMAQLTNPLVLAFGGAGLLTLAASLYFLLRGYGLARLRQERTVDLVMLLGVLVLPHLSAFPMRMMGGNPLDYSSQGLLRTATILVPLAILAVVAASWWKPRPFLISLAIFYGIFVVLFTTVFTNGQGFFTGLVGSLGYWLEQQGVQRGSQPWYYYLLIQVPVYEYLPALGSILGAYLVARRSRRTFAAQQDEAPAAPAEHGTALALLGFWILTSLAAYTIAGEKMPWLTFHIALPMILFTGWALGHTIETIDWAGFQARRGGLVVALLVVFLPGAVAAVLYLLGPNPPFQGKELPQLQATSSFLTALATALGSGYGFYRLARGWPGAQLRGVLTLVFCAFLSLLTARAAFQAAYVNYDNATEYLVYAHSAGGVKQIQTQIEEIAYRTSDGLGMAVGFDDTTTYPYWWYLRNFTNQHFFGANPTRDLREVPVIIAGDNNYGKLEPVVGNTHYKFDYTRMWWPNQDYFNLTWERIKNALTDPQMRAAIFAIWFDRDYTLYGKVTNQNMDLASWSPSGHMRLYIRKDIANELWNYGAAPAPEEAFIDPYEGKGTMLAADQMFGQPGNAPGQFQSPRGLATAPDGSLYVADSRNHRIQHLNADGSVITGWGSFADIATGSAPGGTFNEPWDVAVAPDGAVFVADTWNHRIQKFTADGQFVQMWGFFGQAETPAALWGPRAIVVDGAGRVFVTDTGNKRVVIFDENGNPLGQFGSAGLGPGQFDEPVGIAFGPDGRLFVADTWNQRMQVMNPSLLLDHAFDPAKQWDINAWFGNSLENKPYLAIDAAGNLFATDPEGYRILQFTAEGEFVRYWGDFGAGLDSFGLPSGITADPNGGLWVSDAGNNRIMHFTVP